MRLVGGLRELLRPPPHRGPLIAAGAVTLGAGLALAQLRLGGAAPVFLLAAGALSFWLGAQAPNEDGMPPAYQSVLLVTGAALLYGGLLAAAHVLGADFGTFPAGALTWTSLLVGLLLLWPAFERNSAISLLIAAILGGVALLCAWRWLLGADPSAPYRWLLALYAAALVLCGLALREPARRHAEVLIDAAGLAIAGIALSALLGTGLPGAWEIVVLGAGFGLIAFGALDRSPGPAYLGVVNLAAFIAIEGAGDSLYWWPLILIAGGAAMLAAGLRPRRPLPPEPKPYRAGEAPLAARAGDERSPTTRNGR
ncbi:MAG TPA: hypothetical protein VNS09_12060 [Solirubrobacter sp.]|nr:hypothetical protein [Solirubrobacter sp.]